MNEILKLRAEGKTYKEISELTGKSKSVICYHCGKNQKEKRRHRQTKRRANSVLKIKIERFRCRTLSEKIRSFQRREKSKLVQHKDRGFTAEEFIDKIGENPVCYLTGGRIDLLDGKSYHLDHIMPATRGGNNSLENAGVLYSIVNKMKHNLTVDEFIEVCKKVLEYHNYKVIKRRVKHRGGVPVC